MLCPIGQVGSRGSLRGIARAGLVALLSALAGCAGLGYAGSATSFDPAAFERDDAWIVAPGVPYVAQERREDCGVAALSMVLDYWGVAATREEIERACPLAPGAGARAGDLRDFARAKGLHAFLVPGRIEDLEHELALHRPAVVGLFKPQLRAALSHFEVVVAVNPRDRKVVTLDPARGFQQNSFEGFLQEWVPAGSPLLVCLPPSAPAAAAAPATAAAHEGTR
jgi:ABC-type bacteriocin/lantibiotic exporter with double-glycine peptidase domain